MRLSGARVPVLLVLCGSLVAAEASGPELLDRLTRQQPADQAIHHGLAWLREHPGAASAEDAKQHATAHAALAVMAHLSAGHAIHDPQYGGWLRERLRFVLAMQAPNGYFGARDDSRMYGHGIVTLMLAEAYGMCDDAALEERIRAALVRAVAVTVNAARVEKPAEHAGGWRYHPTSDTSDLSLSGWQLMGLHACQQVGITVPEAVVVQACAYARRLTSDTGAVGYQKRGDDHPALRGLSLLCLAIDPRGADPVMDRVAERITKYPIAWKGKWLFYRAYYDAVGLSRARPEIWRGYRPRLEQMLVDHQHPDGYWPSPPGGNEGDFGYTYTTSMAVLALAVDRHLLPAYQR
ncbi:MAG: hypothetical protein ACOCYP_05870 [Planctomycetota bacterium]